MTTHGKLRLRRRGGGGGGVGGPTKAKHRSVFVLSLGEGVGRAARPCSRCNHPSLCCCLVRPGVVPRDSSVCEIWTLRHPHEVNSLRAVRTVVFLPWTIEAPLAARACGNQFFVCCRDLLVQERPVSSWPLHQIMQLPSPAGQASGSCAAAALEAALQVQHFLLVAKLDWDERRREMRGGARTEDGEGVARDAFDRGYARSRLGVFNRGGLLLLKLFLYS